MSARTLVLAGRFARTRAHLLYHGVPAPSTTLFSGKLPRLVTRGDVQLGERLRVWGFRVPALFGAQSGATFTAGDDVFINEGATMVANHEISLGNHVLIGDFATIFDTSVHPVDEDTGVEIAPVRIEDNAWIGQRATVLPGVTLGRNSVVAAGSVVTCDVKPDTLVAGVPARPVRKLVVGEDWVRRYARR
jgi:maltose O-acetyltransferase